MIGLRLVVTGQERERSEAAARRVAAVMAARLAAQRGTGRGDDPEAVRAPRHVVFIR